MSATKNDSPNLVTIWLRLMKLRVIVLLQVTAICSILMHDLLSRKGAIDASPRGWLDTLATSALVILGGTLSAGGANAINMWYERDIDKGMKRTAKRPLPSGQVHRSVPILCRTSLLPGRVQRRRHPCDLDVDIP